MNARRAGRPSPAMIVAALALVFAMVGTAVAGTDGISSKLTKSKVKSIAKKQAIKQLKANVAGSHVNTADNATNATNAGNANTVGGLTVKNISDFSQSNAPRTILDLAGLQIIADCDGTPELLARSTVNDASIRYFSVESATGPPAAIESPEDEDFDIGEDFDLTDQGTNDEELQLSYTRSNGQHVDAFINIDSAEEDLSCGGFMGHAIGG